ncbi:protein kinase [Nonomuraea sp. PA05]|uniref:serine/threonine-protein kinase n=1 Tax=Nonomuraea sp. PA05 TaxID=2604466 RepID=UPI0011D6EFC9|nr:serine/threonine-protein kinase [Nonomuraea sp. PA05]TYB65992.1 protein kinase [Nonomuraea sp. PA05]
MSRPRQGENLGRIAGYRLTAFLGEGGQGAVYLGLSPSGDEVAIKVLHARMSDDAEARRRFFRQVELARRVAPFCTARVLDMGMHDERPYIVSEYVRGDSLERVVRRDGPRTGGGLERLAVATATALAAIHRAGVVHRDLKPGNVILGPEGPVVIDFGISRALDHAVTQTGAVGTPGYMAPEQVRMDPVGPAADVFSWAATMVFAATGRRAFSGDSVAAVLRALLYEEPEVAGVPGALRGLVVTCLDKDPGRRLTADELVRVLTGGDGPEVTRDAAGASGGVVGGGVAGEGAVTAPWDPADETGRTTRALTSPPPTSPPPTSPAPPTRMPPTPTSPVSPTPTSRTLPVSPTPVSPTRTAPGSAPPAPSPRRQRVPRRALLAAGVALVVVAAVLTATLWPEQPGPGTVTPLVATLSTTAQGTQPSEPLQGHTNDIRAVALGTLGGAPVALTGSDDETARLWDLRTSRQLGSTLEGHTEWVRSVVLDQLDGTAIAVTASDDDTARVWDLRTGEARVLSGHGGDVKGVATVRMGDRHVAVTASADGTARVWDLRTGKPFGKPLTGHDGAVWGVAAGQVGGRAIAVTTGDDGTVRVWDLASGKQAGAPMTGHTGWVRSVALGNVDGVPVAITGGEDTTARVWDLTTGKPIGGPLTGHTGPVWSVAIGNLGQVPVAVTGSEDRTARVWDLNAGAELGTPFTGHDDAVWAAAIGLLDGRPIAVTGGRDQTARIWPLNR